MSQTRNTIEILCKILRENGATKVKAEIFRLAKFNQDDVAPMLWKLLFELLYYCEYGKIDGVSDRACNQLTQDEFVVYVKRQMQRRGFYSPEFAGLAREMSGGSRELLLGVGWLICKENIIQRFMHSCTSPLEEDTFNNHQVSLEGFEPPKLSKDVVDRVQQLLWFNNKLRLNLRTLYAIQREKNLLKHKIHEATYGISADPDKSHLTMFEVHLLRHPDLLKKNLQLLEQDNERLQNLLKWREHEDTFWKWMESVLDEKLKERSEQHDPPATVETGVNLNTQEVMQQSVTLTQECHNELQEAIMNYEAIVDNLEKLWETKSLTVSEEDLDRLLFSIDSELSIQKANLVINYTDQKQPADKPTRFLYKKSDSRPTAPIATTASQTVEDTGQVGCIQDEIQSLWKTVKELQDEIDSKQDSFKEEMEQLNSKFRQAVCIPPMGRREYGGLGAGDNVVLV